MSRFRKTTWLNALLISWLGGLALSHRYLTIPIWWWLFGLLPLLARSRRLLILLSLLTVGLGWWRGSVVRQQTLIYERMYRQLVKLRVTALNDAVYSESRSLSFDGGAVELTEPFHARLPGHIKIEVIGITSVFRQDRLEITGRLYPSGGARQGSLRFAQAQLLSRNINRLELMRLRFSAGMQTALPEPQASFGLGILVGQRSTLPKAVNDQLSTVGLTHIIAVSGYNLTIIIQFLGRRLGRSKYQTLIFSSGLIAAFVLITGFSASIVRAAVVSMLSLGAWYYGRQLKPVTLLLFAAVITTVWNPIYLWSDIGWYLSFLAFFGVIILAPLITTHFWKREPHRLWSLFIETSSAQIMTTPLIMYIFGRVSLIALLSNVVIVPLVPLAMLLALIAGIGGWWLPVIVGMMAWPARVLMGYMLALVAIFASFPHASAKSDLSLSGLLGFYGIILLSCWWLWRRAKPKYVKITE